MYESKCDYCKFNFWCNLKEDYQKLEKQWRENPNRDYLNVSCLSYYYKDY
jgi:hypothetical protein